MPAWLPRLLILAIVSSAGLLSGCATIATGGVQALNIQSQPPGAECSLTRRGQTLGSLVTPGQITVSRSAAAIQVTCRKAGYQDTGEFMVATHEPLALLDSVPLGVVSLPARAVDMASGAYAQYPEALRVWLVPSGSMGDFANTAAGLSPAASTFDGQYFGAFRSRAIRANFDPIQINLQVVSGRGTGTATTDAWCAVPGEVTLAVDSSGAVVGRFQLEDDHCQGSAMTFTGQIKADRMTIKLVKGMEALLVKQP